MVLIVIISPVFFSSSNMVFTKIFTSLSIGFDGFLTRRAHPSWAKYWQWRGICVGVEVNVGLEMVDDKLVSTLIFSNSITLGWSFNRSELSRVECSSNVKWIFSSSSDSNVLIQDSFGQKKKLFKLRSDLFFVVEVVSVVDVVSNFSKG